ncbi:hypothetical protein K435DRAFT_842272 [Dendrothele bispora CBS 962.96]|uniref:Uncharacterized protein n=1 Tax=Dendrothele bispora (strain CBS 962.96) TaxID=1314807 RepID=A0A4S8LGM3_DENBC|nr:hypothetical protein K435DRAFT_842272 [Dendrothele bispora CBS 962.96]
MCISITYACLARRVEWLLSLPLHPDLYAHLNLEPLKFAHVPVLLNADGKKMSTGNGDVQVVDYVAPMIAQSTSSLDATKLEYINKYYVMAFLRRRKREGKLKKMTEGT